MNDWFNCGCGGSKRTEEEVEEAIREVEKERKTVVIPVKSPEAPIPVKKDDVFAPQRKTVEVGK